MFDFSMGAGSPTRKSGEPAHFSTLNAAVCEGTPA
jgi:hypothetical protein